MATPRASWIGHLRLASVSCQVRLYRATSEAQRLSLNLLHAETGQRIQMRPHDPGRGEVSRDELVKGYEHAPGRYVLISDAELAQLVPEQAKAIQIERFVAEASVDQIYLDEPYYLAPAGQLDDEPFRVIQTAMRRTEKAAIGRVVLSQRERLALLQPRGPGLLLTTLRSLDEVRDPAPFFAEIGQGRLDPALLELAEELIAAESGAFEPSHFEDHYQTALLALIQRKLAGEPAPVVEPPPPPEFVDLMAALQRSLEHGRKPPARSRTRHGAPTPQAAPRPARRRSGQPPD